MIALKRISAALGLLAATATLPAMAQDAAFSPNQRTADAIAASLRSHSELNKSRIAIETREGTVLLVGTVSNPALKAEAVRRAGLAPGVINVVDRLQVTGDTRVRTVQYQPGQPAQVAMGGLHHRGGAVDGGMVGGPVEGGMVEGGMVAGPATTGPAYDGPLPEGAAGMTGPAQAYQSGQPNYAWPSYAPPGNFSAVGYPTAYPWQAWPNIGPFYPYPEVPLDWRAVTLRWDDGIWWLDFRKHYTRPFFTPYPFGLFAY
ncbi:MAG: putative periplasmic or secreted lipoprotein [Planctomycetota bacterium]|nr:putative periplasmic or secreted lipoprotein [Planctomycetota bacterium]